MHVLHLDRDVGVVHLLRRGHLHLGQVRGRGRDRGGVLRRSFLHGLRPLGHGGSGELPRGSSIPRAPAASTAYLCICIVLAKL